jgi:hypothetical protein
MNSADCGDDGSLGVSLAEGCTNTGRHPTCVGQTSPVLFTRGEDERAMFESSTDQPAHAAPRRYVVVMNYAAVMKKRRFA